MGWYLNEIARGVCSLLKWHGPRTQYVLGPFIFRGCDLTAEWLLARELVRVQLPATAPYFTGRAPTCATESPKLSLLGAAPRRPANFYGAVAEKLSACLASSAKRERYPPDSTISYCGENEIQASLISSASVGATPTPATTACVEPSREVIRPAVCKPAVIKQCRKMTTGALPAFPTISGSVAQSEEQPVVCGKAEGASPFGSAILLGA